MDLRQFCVLESERENGAANAFKAAGKAHEEAPGLLVPK
jgi:hypothetical protein